MSEVYRFELVFDSIGDPQLLQEILPACTQCDRKLRGKCVRTWNRISGPKPTPLFYHANCYEAAIAALTPTA